jgi:hypothetical protein
MVFPVTLGLMAALMVPQAEVCSALTNGKCNAPSHHFSSDVGSLTVLTSIEGHKMGDVVKHVWRKGNREILSVPLKLGQGRVQVHSSKPIGAADVGHWTVLVVGPGGRELRRVSFGIEPAQPSKKGASKPLKVPYQPPIKE